MGDAELSGGGLTGLVLIGAKAFKLDESRHNVRLVWVAQFKSAVNPRASENKSDRFCRFSPLASIL